MTDVYRLIRLNRREFEIRNDHALAVITFRRGSAATITTATESFDLVRSGWAAPKIIEQRPYEPRQTILARGSCSGRFFMMLDDMKLRFGPLSVFGVSYGWIREDGAAIIRYAPLTWSKREHCIEVDLEDNSRVVRLLSVGAYLLQLAYQDSAVGAMMAAVIS